MKFETFQAGVWRQRYQYKSLEPVPVNREWVWEDATLNTLLEAASRALGELNVLSPIVMTRRRLVKENAFPLTKAGAKLKFVVDIVMED